MLRIKLNESRNEAKEPKFLDASLKSKIEFELPSLYTSKSLAVFKGTEDIDPDVAWDIEDLSWDVDSATTSGEYLMVAFKDVVSAEDAKATMEAEYKKAALPEALELVDCIDVEALRNALMDIVGKSKGTDWELDYSLGDINDLADAPGIIDCAYAESEYSDHYTVISLGVGAFGYYVGYTDLDETIETTSADEAVKSVQEIIKKYGAKE